MTPISTSPRFSKKKRDEWFSLACQNIGGGGGGGGGWSAMLKAQKINGDFLFLFCMDYCDSDVNHFVVACKDFMCVRRRSWTFGCICLVQLNTFT